MKSNELIQPISMSNPIAYDGTRNSIPEAATGTNFASIAEGFPDITMKSPADGGLPPRGQDCNGMFYLSTDQKVYLQNGGIITFEQGVSDLIGGYPKNAILDYIDSDDVYHKVQSLIDDNTFNFIETPSYIGDNEHWQEIAINGGGSGASLPLFTPVIQDHVLSFEESKGYALQGTYVYKTAIAGSRYGYPTFVQKCIDEKTEGTATQVTLGSNTITMYVNANGHQFYDIADKSAVDTFYNTYGIADFYGVDEENERIFLPRNNYFAIIGSIVSIPVVGNGMTLGLTDGSSFAGLENNNVAGSQHLNTAATAYGYPVGTTTSITDPSLLLNVSYGVTTDPEKSGLVADISSAIKPDTNKCLYYIVGNTEVESAITDVTEVAASENDTLPLFTGMYFDFKPNNPSWLKAGEQANNGGIYTSCYNTLVGCLTEANNIYDLKVIETSDMIAGIDYSEYWKVNQDEMWFKTPTKISYLPINADTAPVIGNGIAVGLTNGSVLAGMEYQIPGTYAGLNAHFASYGKPVSSSGGSTVDGERFPSNSIIGVTTDPENSGLIADLSSAKSTTAQLYFKVANAVENLELLDAGEVLESLADKVDETNTEWAIKACMPDYAAGISKAENHEYTAETYGLLMIYVVDNASTSKLILNGTTYNINHVYKASVDVQSGSTTTIYLSKGDTYKVIPGRSGDSSIIFFPLKGVTND